MSTIPNDQVVFLRITLGFFPNTARPVATAVAVRSPASCGRLESPATVVRSLTGRSVTGGWIGYQNNPKTAKKMMVLMLLRWKMMIFIISIVPLSNYIKIIKKNGKWTFMMENDDIYLSSGNAMLQSHVISILAGESLKIPMFHG
jgi:hypothetical protein